MSKSLKGGFTKHTEKNADFAKGGNTPMFGQGDRTVTAPQDASGAKKPGDTNQGNTSDSGDKFACGGKGKMFGYQGAVSATAGITGAR